MMFVTYCHNRHILADIGVSKAISASLKRIYLVHPVC